jgi:hypothetical protein
MKLSFFGGFSNGGYCDQMKALPDGGKHLALDGGPGFLRDDRIGCAITAQRE